MSNRWPGGLIRKTPVTPTGPLQNGTAPGIWTMEQAAYWTKQGLWPTAGNFLAVEDVFSTWLYTGNSSTQTITNGINLSGQGGLVWTKSRSGNFDNCLIDTSRGVGQTLYSNSNVANQNYGSGGVNLFTSTGYGLASNTEWNNSSNTYASWTFREAANFFDVVTYTGNGANRNIAHSLGVAPGCIIVKRTDAADDWQVYHRSNTNAQYMVLNSTAAKATGTTRWNSTTPTATEFTVGTDTTVNANGGTYVAYLFAHDTSSTGLIQCGSYTGNGSSTGPSVTLGWEPQWLLVKDATTGSYDWRLVDNMRGMPVGSGAPSLFPNLNNAEFTSSLIGFNPTATGFQVAGSHGSINASGSTYIYIAIRRGPMRTPTVGTSVFAPVYASGTAPTYTTGFVTDMAINRAPSSPSNNDIASRLTGTGNMATESTSAEFTDAANVWSYMNGWRTGSRSGYISWNFRRAPSFFDEVCYGTATRTVFALNHNLGVVPEMMIVKRRDGTGNNWVVYHSALGNTKQMVLNLTDAVSTNANVWDSTTPSATTFTIGADVNVSGSGTTYVAYLFASCPGVSKVGSYTGTGTTQTINCGFTTGARFVLIKRTDSTGDWYVWDSARGIVAGNDPYLLLNSTAAEVTGTDYVDTDNSGFQLSSTAPAAINANGGTFIYLAIS